VEQSPSWEAASHSGDHEIPPHFMEPQVHYRVQKSPPLVSILSQMNPVHTFPPHFPKIHCNIIFPSAPRSSEWILKSHQHTIRYVNGLVPACVLCNYGSELTVRVICLLISWVADILEDNKLDYTAATVGNSGLILGWGEVKKLERKYLWDLVSALKS
jgi:hypothetical protein